MAVDMRVYELAEELGLNRQKLVQLINELPVGFTVNNYMTKLTGGEVQTIRNELASGGRADPASKEVEAVHYISINPNAESYARDVQPALDWKSAIFDDLTQGGRQLSWYNYGANREGKVVSLFGEIYCCRAGLHHSRPDTMFIFRVEDADSNLPRYVPKSYQAKFKLLERNDSPPRGKPLVHLFGDEAKPPQSKEDESRVQVATPTIKRRRVSRSGVIAEDILGSFDDEAIPSTHLKELLHRDPLTLARSWRPRTFEKANKNPGEFLDSFRQPWQKFNLLKEAPESLSLPLRNIMRGGDKSRWLAKTEFEAILELFSLEALNTYIQNRHHDDLAGQRLLRAFADIPLANQTRCKVWKEIAASLPTEQLPFEIAHTLKSLKPYPADQRHVWFEQIGKLIADENSPGSDSELHDLFNDSGINSAYPDALSWAKTFLASEPQPDSSDEAPDTDESAQVSSQPKQFDESVQDVASDGLNEPSDEWPVFLAWVVERSGTAAATIQQTVSRAQRTLENCQALGAQISEPDDVVRWQKAIGELRQEIVDWLEEFPEVEALRQNRDECQSAFNRASDVLGDKGACLVLELEAPVPSELQNALDVFDAQEELVSDLPAWLVKPTTEASSEESQLDSAHWLAALCDSSFRKGVVSLSRAIDQAGLTSAQIDIASISPPDEELETSERLQHFDRSFRALLDNASLGDVDDAHTEWISRAREHGIKPDALRETYEEVISITPQLGASLVKEFIRHLEGEEPEAIRSYVSRFKKAANEFLDFVGTEQIDAPLSMIEQRMTTRGEEGSVATFAHDRVTGRGRLATLLVVEKEDYWWMYLPVVIETDRRRSMDFELEADLERPSLKETWPPRRASIRPKTVSIAPEDWIESPSDSSKFRYEIKLELPFREPPDTYLHVKLRGVRGSRVLAEKILRWDSRCSKNREKASLDWGQDAMDYIREHPIGIQKSRDAIIKCLLNTQSVAVFAPRRFGKTTIARYIKEEGPKQQLLVAETISCTSNRREDNRPGLKYHKIWNEVSEDLQLKTGSSLTLPSDARLPSRDAFDHVREAAHRRGYEAIALVIDEAQLFFPPSDGGRLGDLIKDRLENEWALRRPGKVPLVFCFIGLPELRKRIPNLLGATTTFRSTPAEEQDLYKLIEQRSGKLLETTRGARLLLSQVSENFYVLQQLLNALVSLINQEGRWWFNRRDVNQVYDGLLRDLRNGGASELGGRVRDALNEAESVNEWRPRREYPVAAALAHTKYETGARGKDLLHLVVRKLNDWIDILGGYEGNGLRYDVRLVTENLSRLSDSELLKGTSFRSKLLEAWLIGRVESGIELESEMRDCLFRGAVPHVTVPADAEEVASGSQARILLSETSGTKKVYREVRVGNDQTRAEVLGNLTTLKEVLAAASAHEGTPYVFELEQVGLSSRDASRIIEVYPWIEGADLGSYEGRLPAQAVVDLGERLAKGLQFLHGCNVLHRDIRPRNVVLRHRGKTPVLIDFGLARLSNRVGDTTIPDEFAAPEVRSGSGRWSNAADVFSLGQTLSHVLNTDTAPTELLELLVQCAKEDPTERPSSHNGALVDAFAEIGTTLELSRKREDSWREFRKLMGTNLAKSWFGDICKKFRATIEAAEIGLLLSDFDRASAAADFLNHVMEASPYGCDNLKQLEDKTRDRNDRSALKFVRHLRNLDAHPFKNDDRRYRKFQEHPAEERKHTMEVAAEIIGAESELDSLGKVLEWFLASE
ncbi:protein kinase domain-containing protein [Persicimonas caeni]|nr:protein kinase [Persicimonas caeni]